MRPMGPSGTGGGRLPWMQVLIVITALVVGLVAGRFVTGGGPESSFESSAKLLVGPISADRSTLDAAGLLARTYSEILESTTALIEATSGVELDDPDSVNVKAVPDERSRTIVLIVTHDDPAVPPRVASSLAGNLTSLIETDLAESQARAAELAAEKVLEAQIATDAADDAAATAALARVARSEAVAAVAAAEILTAAASEDEKAAAELAEAEAKAARDEAAEAADVAETDAKAAADLAATAVEAASIAQSAALPDVVPGRVRVIEDPDDPAQAVGDSTTLAMIGFGLLGLLVGLGLVRLISISGGVTVGATALAAAGVADIGIVSTSGVKGARSSSGGLDTAWAVAARAGTSMADGHDLTASRLDLLCRADGDYRSLALVSVDYHVAYPELVVNIAAAFTRNGQRVDLVDGDVERASLTRLVGLGRSARQRDPGEIDPVATLLGIENVMTYPDEDIWELGGGKQLRILGGGGGPLSAPSDMVAIRSFADEIPEDTLMVISVPPVHRSTMGLAWATAADHVVLMTRRNRTLIRELKASVTALRSVGLNPDGALQVESGRWFA